MQNAYQMILLLKSFFHIRNQKFFISGIIKKIIKEDCFFLEKNIFIHLKGIFNKIGRRAENMPVIVAVVFTIQANLIDNRKKFKIFRKNNWEY